LAEQLAERQADPELRKDLDCLQDNDFSAIAAAHPQLAVLLV